MFNILVTAMTLIALGFVVLWWLHRDVRASMELPKYRFARWSEELPPQPSNANFKSDVTTCRPE